MSAQQQIRKLKSLLERIQANRHELTRPAVVALVGPPAVEAAAVEPAAAQIDPPVKPRQRPVAAARATPMEQAIQTSAEREPVALDIPVDDPDDDEPVLTIEAPSGELDAVAISDSTPTAPVHTRAPDIAESAAPHPPASGAQPQRMTTATPQPSAPIATVISRAAPQTFGELIDRALSLRPR